MIDFELKDKNGELHKLSEVRAKYIVLYFYPKDSTAGCTVEAVEFSKDIDKFNKLNTKVIGVSGGNEESKTKFVENHNLKVLLLSDPDFEVCKKYKVYGEKSFLGRKFMGIKRMTFVLDDNNRVIKVYDKVKPEIHSKEVLDFIKRL